MNRTPSAGGSASATRVLWAALSEVPDAVLHSAEALLAAAERARAARFRRESDQRAFLTGRALTAALATYLGIDPRIRIRDGGKPALRAAGADGPDFSISHSGGWVAVAMGGAQAVGIDLEPVDREVDALALAERFFVSEEHAALRALPAEARRSHFLAAWTVKEAWAKAMGQGLSADLGTVRLETPPGITLREAGADWTIALYRPEPDFHLAIALRHPGRASPAIELGRARWAKDGLRVDHASISPVASNRSATSAVSIIPVSASSDNTPSEASRA